MTFIYKTYIKYKKFYIINPLMYCAKRTIYRESGKMDLKKDYNSNINNKLNRKSY